MSRVDFLSPAITGKLMKPILLILPTQAYLVQTYLVQAYLVQAYLVQAYLVGMFGIIISMIKPIEAGIYGALRR
jgi:hypothetical protein